MKEQFCPVSQGCGGCQLLHLPYAQQLEQKQRRVENLLRRICPVRPIVGMDDPFHYRNKVHAAFALDHRGRIISGVYAPGSHRVVPVEKCLLEDEQADRVVGVVRELMEKFRVSPYDEDRGTGVMRHVLIRTGRRTGQMLVTLVIGQPRFAGREAFVQELVRRCPFITTVVVNLNGFHTSMVLGKSSRTVYGRGFIEDELCGMRFGISPQSFYQINPVQTEKLYALAIGYAGLTGSEELLDAYCGVGTIGLAAARRAGTVTGVELNDDAVQDAIRNARRNHAENARFFQGDAGAFLRAQAAAGRRFDVVMMDPPRAGSDEKFLRALCQTAPRRVVYVSCMPETLARDLKYLTAHGYRALEATPVDMFPHTEHVETVMSLVQQNPDDIVKVGIDADELAVTKAESKATYGEIQARVKEQTGLNVTPLYIAQVKRKHGIIERECYNKAKSENAKMLICPPDKEKAIEEALRFFGMIA